MANRKNPIITRATRANMFAAMQVLGASTTKAQQVAVKTASPTEEIIRPVLKNAEMDKPMKTNIDNRKGPGKYGPKRRTFRDYR